jgi:TolA-binding protein
MGAVTYPDSRVAEFINSRMIPVQLLYDAQPYSSQYNVKWTPTIITLDENGKEHHRIVGFLPPDEFIPGLLLGLAKVSFDRDDFDEALSDLEKLLNNYPKSSAAPEAIYLRGVATYKSTHKPEPLKEAFEQLRREYPTSEWAKRATPYGLL